MALFGKDGCGARAAFFDEAADFAFDFLLGFRGETVVVAGEVDVAEFLGVAEAGYEVEGGVGGVLDVLSILLAWPFFFFFEVRGHTDEIPLVTLSAP